MHVAPFQPQCVTSGCEPGDTFLKNNYDICQGINMLKLGIVLDQMVEQGWLDEYEAKAFSDQAGGLLAVIRGANGRGHAKHASLAAGIPTLGQQLIAAEEAYRKSKEAMNASSYEGRARTAEAWQEVRRLRLAMAL